ncbi:MAG: hypothetical protein ABI353_19985 [Isosphaeraceae bacterium]
MSGRRFVALPCILALGGFSGERIFEVTLANGSPYRSIAPRHFCWNIQGRLVAETEPATEAPGMVAARVIDQTDDGQMIVEVPDGEVIAVDQKIVRSRPTEIKPPEPKAHVSV